MIRLNRIFGRKTTQEHEPQTDSAPHAVFAPPDTDGEWDEELADAYLLAQEQALPPEGARPTAASQPVSPATADPVIDTTAQDRVAMARQQLAAAQAPVARVAAAPLDLSDPVGSGSGQVGRRAGRVKTRLLGFDHAPGLTQDPIEAARSTATEMIQDTCPVGWIVVIRGPGRGAHFALFNGVSQIGRGGDQAIKLDFGDGSISRTNHAAIAYDDETNSFFLGHGGKTNIVRLNDRPVISTETLKTRDTIRIGETTLLFVALCSDQFRWTANQGGPDDFG